MSVLQHTNTAFSDRQARLAERLEAEWDSPQDEEPVIIEEAPKIGTPPNHLYVIWQEWSDLSPLERSRMVLKAYEHKLGSANAANLHEVTLAMGLTPDEARMMKIEF